MAQGVGNTHRMACAGVINGTLVIQHGAESRQRPPRTELRRQSLRPEVQIPCVDVVALMALSGLEAMERPWLKRMQLKAPESIALAFHLA